MIKDLRMNQSKPTGDPGSQLEELQYTLQKLENLKEKSELRMKELEVESMRY
jgi:hypothetical protein